MANGATPTSEITFGTWYCDHEIAGHFLVCPSIFVAKTTQRIFSPIEENGCEALIEVIQRIVLSILVILIAIPALVFAPIGVIFKGIATLSYTPEIVVSPPAAKLVLRVRSSSLTHVASPPPLAPIRLHSDPLPRANGVGAAITPPRPSDSDPLPRTNGVGAAIIPPRPSDSVSTTTAAPPPAPRSSEPLLTPASAPKPAPLPYAQEALGLGELTLTRANTLLDRINPKKMEKGQLEEIRALLQHRSITDLLSIPPTKKENDPLEKFVVKFHCVRSRFENLERVYDFRAKTFTSEEGEIPVKDDGSCLFASFVQHSLLAASIHSDNPLDIDPLVAQERKKAMDWIADNYKTDKDLQGYLLGSMSEHYMNKSEKLEQEIRDLRANLASKDLPLEQAVRDQMQKRIEAIPKEMEQMFEKYQLPLSMAQGEAHTGIFFDVASHLVPDYIQEMRQADQFGGEAELYALSILHEVCVCVHRKNGAIDPRPYLVLNDKFKGKPERHFSKTTNHYNPYFPTN